MIKIASIMATIHGMERRAERDTIRGISLSDDDNSDSHAESPVLMLLTMEDS